LFLLRTIIVVTAVITFFIARFLYFTFKIYSAIRLSSCKCVINSVFSVQILKPCPHCRRKVRLSPLLAVFC